MIRKIVTIGHSYVVAANRAVMRRLAEDHDLEITVVTPRFFHGDLRSLEAEPEPAESRLKIVPIDVYGSKKIHFFYYHPGQLREILSESFDYCYLWEEPYIVSGYQLASALQKRQIPFSIFTAQNILKRYPPPFSYFERKALNWSQSVWACGVLVQETLEEKKITSRPIEVVPLFVDLSQFTPLTSDQKDRGRRDLGLEAEHVIGYMGRLTDEKGILIYLESLLELPRDKSWQGLMIGSGPREGEIRDWLKNRGLDEKVRVMSAKHDEVPKLLPLMDVILCPSQTTSFWREQFGRMIVEAFASGVAVIASDSGEIPYVVGDSGVIVPEKNLDDWALQARTLLYDEPLRRMYIQSGLKRVRKFSVDHIAEIMKKNLVASDFSFR